MTLKVAKCLTQLVTHEWINEIPTVPIYYLAKPQRGERATQNSGERRPVELDSSLTL